MQEEQVFCLRIVPGPSALIATVLLALLCVTGCRSIEEAPPPPNLLLVTLDTFRSDRPGFAGNPDGLTPNLDALAAESTVFDRAVTTMATTFPAHASMLTGMVPSDHGVRWNGDTLADEFRTVAEILRDEGYDTAAFVGHRAMLTRGGLDQGFSTLSDERSEVRGPVFRPGSEVTELAREWLNAERDRPYFAWVHYFDAHTPYAVRPYAAERLGDYDGLLAEGVDTEMIRASRDEILASDRELEALRALYDASILEVDAQVGKLIDGLRESGGLQETVVIVVADHGQALGEHGDFLHGGLLWEVAVDVPLMIRLPEGGSGQRIDQRVGALDLGATLLDLARVAPPPSMQGRSLVPATRGKELPPTVYFAETKAVRDDDPEATEPAAVAIYFGRHKAIQHPDRLLLFDMEADPRESAPLGLDENRELIQEMERLLAAYREGGAGRRSTGVEELDPEVLEELRALGYL